MALSVSHGGQQTIVTSQSLSDEVLVGTIDGVAALKRDGASWKLAHQALEGMNVHALLFEPASGVWFAGAQHGGIHASTDGGRTWERRDVGLTEDNVYSLSATTVDGHVRLFAGTEPVHLFVSDDLGLTWSEKPAMAGMKQEKWTFPAPPHIAHLKHINFIPGEPHAILCSVEVGGLFRSDDDGETFREVEGMYLDVHRCVVDAANPNRMFVTGGRGLWATEDGGETWANMFGPGSEPGGYPDQLAYVPSNTGTMFVSSGQLTPGKWRDEHTSRTRISRSTDGGHTWSVLSGGLEDQMTHSVEAMTLEEAGGAVQVFAALTSGDILWTADGGDSWTTISAGLHPVSKGGHYKPLITGAPVD